MICFTDEKTEAQTGNLSKITQLEAAVSIGTQTQKLHSLF